MTCQNVLHGAVPFALEWMKAALTMRSLWLDHLTPCGNLSVVCIEKLCLGMCIV